MRAAGGARPGPCVPPYAPASHPPRAPPRRALPGHAPGSTPPPEPAPPRPPGPPLPGHAPSPHHAPTRDRLVPSQATPSSPRPRGATPRPPAPPQPFTSRPHRVTFPPWPRPHQCHARRFSPRPLPRRASARPRLQHRPAHAFPWPSSPPTAPRPRLRPDLVLTAPPPRRRLVDLAAQALQPAGAGPAAAQTLRGGGRQHGAREAETLPQRPPEPAAPLSRAQDSRGLRPTRPRTRDWTAAPGQGARGRRACPAEGAVSSFYKGGRGGAGRRPGGRTPASRAGKGAGIRAAGPERGRAGDLGTCAGGRDHLLAPAHCSLTRTWAETKSVT